MAPSAELANKLFEIGTKQMVPCAVLVRDGKFLIGLRNYTQATWKEISVWTLPGGRCDECETLGEALKREIEEEVGINDLVIDEFLGEVVGAKEGDRVLVFKCRTQQNYALLEPEKFSEWRWVTISEVPENFINPRLLNLVKDYFSTYET